RVTSVNSAGFVIAKDSKNPDAAWEFVKFATGQTGQTRLAELGFAIPVLQSVAESPSYLEQKSAPINHKVFLDALEYARPKPTFRGYEEWASVVGDGLYNVWIGDVSISDALADIVPDADAVLANNQS
ncbi:MAG: extracellular solute-binding protein, partial [Anaerolineae bacterium]|nr:extracellular solute-binding protein [Anaerolineae bacterium]